MRKKMAAARDEPRQTRIALQLNAIQKLTLMGTMGFSMKIFYCRKKLV